MADKPETIVYEPNARFRQGFFNTWLVMARNIVASRELIYQLFKRDFLMAYKKSFLGMTWIVLSPLIGIISWVLMNATGILDPGDVGIPYPAYVLLSSSIWGLFMGFYSSALGTLSSGQGFIMQVKFPHEALLVKQTAQHLANFTLTFVLNIIVLLLFGVTPSWHILLFPLITLPLFFVGAGLGLLVGVVSVVATDVSRFVDMGLKLLFYLTPVVYSVYVENETLRRIVNINPLTYLIGGVRDLIVYGTMEHWDRFLAVSLFSFIFFLISWRLFYVSEDRVVEKLF